jgi:TRAP-type mannitol/chloroaromatic compound transport system substrate-binding protein
MWLLPTESQRILAEAPERRYRIRQVSQFLGRKAVKRRDVLKAAGLGLAGSTALAMPAIAQTMPQLKWRMASSFPKSLDTIYGAAEVFAKYVSEATDGNFEIQSFPGGELFPALQVLDKVQDGTVEVGHTAMYYYWGKDPTFGFATSVPFGLNNRLQNAWWYYGGGKEVLNEFFATYDVVGVAGGNTGCQMGGWFRKEINSIADMNGVKMRIGGFGGAIIQKIGVVPQQIAGGEIYPALEKGTIDAAEWVGPYDDQKLGFNKVAPFYYYPGWWEGGSMLHVIVGKNHWDELPRSYQAIVEAAGAYANFEMMARYDVLNPKALRELVAGGAQLRPFPQDVMEACANAAAETYAELNASNAAFKKVYDSWSVARAEGNLWWQAAEGTFDNFMMGLQRAKAL